MRKELFERNSIVENVNNDYKFHTFGDPALPLPFPRKKESIVNYSDLGEIPLVEEVIISFNESSDHSSILIRENEKDFIFDYEIDSLIYTVPGPTYVQTDVSGNSTCFRIPVDAGLCENCLIFRAQFCVLRFSGKITKVEDPSSNFDS